MGCDLLGPVGEPCAERACQKRGLCFIPPAYHRRATTGIEGTADPRIGMRLDEYLVDLYREVANQADSREVAEVFGNLLNLEQQEEIAVTRNALSIQDL